MFKRISIFTTLLLCACSLTGPPHRTPAPPQRVPQPAPSPPQRAPQPSTVPAPQPMPPPSVPAPPPSAPEHGPAPKVYVLSQTSQALVTQARTQTASGDFAVAAATIERALRIEPAQPLLWIELGKVRQAARNFAQAESTARKALTLASGDMRTQAAAWTLIAASLRARGKEVEAAEAAARAAALQPD